MRRTNKFDVIPWPETDDELLRRLLDASAALWNEVSTNIINATLTMTAISGNRKSKTTSKKR
jgi:hypothetical protein